MNEKSHLHFTYILLKSLAFPHAERLWDLEPGLQCGVIKGGNSGNARFFVLDAFVFCTYFFFALPRSF